MASILAVEVLTDPLIRGYSGMTATQVLADLRTVYRTRNLTTMTGRQVQDEVVDAEYDALTDAKKSQFLALTASVDLDPFGLAANVIKDVFGGPSATAVALGAARVENISRETELGLIGTKVGHIETVRS